MRIGIDFDNTIVSYDGIFHKVALEQGVVPPETPVNKVSVRDHLRRTGMEDIWTEMQGYVYGARMAEAEAYPGVLDGLHDLLASGHELFIISHKTRHPFIGPQYDLHCAARGWIEANLQDTSNELIAEDHIYFELTKAEKIDRIGSLACDVFIDDLPEILLAEHFPTGTRRILFDPEGHHEGRLPLDIGRIRNWDQLPNRIAQGA